MYMCTHMHWHMTGHVTEVYWIYPIILKGQGIIFNHLNGEYHTNAYSNSQLPSATCACSVFQTITSNIIIGRLGFVLAGHGNPLFILQGWFDTLQTRPALPRILNITTLYHAVETAPEEIAKLCSKEGRGPNFHSTDSSIAQPQQWFLANPARKFALWGLS